jgi:hypothetical protein
MGEEEGPSCRATLNRGMLREAAPRSTPIYEPEAAVRFDVDVARGRAR